MPLFRGCAISQVHFDDPVLVEFVIPSADMYRFVLLNCPPNLLPDDSDSEVRSASQRSEEGTERRAEERDLSDLLSERTTRDAKLGFLLTDFDEERPTAPREEQQQQKEEGKRDVETLVQEEHLKTEPRANSADKYKSKQISVEMDFTMLNPGGSQLPLGSAPYPLMYAFMVGVWFWLVVLYSILIVWKALG